MMSMVPHHQNLESNGAPNLQYLEDNEHEFYAYKKYVSNGEFSVHFRPKFSILPNPISEVAMTRLVIAMNLGINRV